MNHYFDRMQPVILNPHNIDIIKPLLNQFIDQVKGEIEPGLKEALAGLWTKSWKPILTWRDINQCAEEASCHFPQS